MLKKAEESSIQYSRRVGTSICVRALETFHTVRDFYSNPKHLLCSPRAFGQSLYRVLPDRWDWTRMHALEVIHRWKLCENVDSVKIKVPFYTTDIDILRVASMHRIVIHCIDISMNRYTPNIYTHAFIAAFWNRNNTVSNNAAQNNNTKE